MEWDPQLPPLLDAPPSFQGVWICTSWALSCCSCMMTCSCLSILLCISFIWWLACCSSCTTPLRSDISSWSVIAPCCLCLASLAAANCAATGLFLFSSFVARRAGFSTLKRVSSTVPVGSKFLMNRFALTLSCKAAWSTPRLLLPTPSWPNWDS